ncbi:hypothetical protein Echvi_2586 [Echinicola vietnamensis DSM 17526]|uniref:Uncharacterized protein n=1 Tax=Echinicola vietnamensis (strain DSM 17526 / LMG 23754 / KMM 6221) TaxID=926556 RepID=L0G0J1_ECHVK|nr:hypothetical protein Echvi_2586 [Echinicola vietnamensis DSM 17526]
MKKESQFKKTGLPSDNRRVSQAILLPFYFNDISHHQNMTNL